MTAKLVPAGNTWNNFHTHTFRCHHATGDVGDFAAKAKKLGMTKLGMSDHAYVQGEGDNPLHMSSRDIPEYLRLCREADANYKDLKIFCGVECDYDPSDESFFKEYYLDELGMDYLIGSVHELKGGSNQMNCFSNRHFGVKELKIYTDLYVRMLESGLFTFYGHPDLFGMPITVGQECAGWDENAASAAREILEAAAANKAVLEINVSGKWKTVNRGYPEIIYPRWEFWEMASDFCIDVIVNTDAHSLERLEAYSQFGIDLAEKNGLRRMELG